METIVNAVTPGNSGSVLVRTNTDDVREGGEDPAVNPFLPETMETIVNLVAPGDSGSALVRTTTDNEREGGEHPAVKRSDALKHNVHNASPMEICIKIHCDSTNLENFENGEVSVIEGECQYYDV